MLFGKESVVASRATGPHLAEGPRPRPCSPTSQPIQMVTSGRPARSVQEIIPRDRRGHRCPSLIAPTHTAAPLHLRKGRRRRPSDLARLERNEKVPVRAAFLVNRTTTRQAIIACRTPEQDGRVAVHQAFRSQSWRRRSGALMIRLENASVQRYIWRSIIARRIQRTSWPYTSRRTSGAVPLNPRTLARRWVG